MEITLKVTQESFTKENGEKIEYLSYTAEIEGETVRFVPKTEDKKFVEHFAKRVLYGGNSTPAQ